VAENSDRPLRPNWLTGKIVFVERGIRRAFSYEGAGPYADRKDPYLRLHFVSVYVRDQEPSKKFFLEKLGFNLVQDVRFASGGAGSECQTMSSARALATQVQDLAADSHGKALQIGLDR
jgi:hypothetical protein